VRAPEGIAPPRGRRTAASRAGHQRAGPGALLRLMHPGTQAPDLAGTSRPEWRWCGEEDGLKAP